MKPFGDVFLDTLRQVEQLQAGGRAVVDQHQRLQLVHAGIAVAETLPAGAFDQPASGQFHLPVRLRVSHQIRVLRFDPRDHSGRHQRILEEAAGIAEHRRVRQFFTADAADGAADIAGRRLLDALLAQALTDRAVFQMQVRGAIKLEAHPQDQPTSRLLLEHTVAVAEIALLQAEIPQLAALAVQRSQAGKHVLDLDTIGADVLHRRGADGAGNQAEVFQPGKTLGQRVLHERMPRFARFRLDHHATAIVAEHADAARGHAQYQRRNIRREQQVAAAADHQQRHVMGRGIGQRFADIVITVGFGKQLRAHIDAKRIEGLQRYLRLHLQTHKRPFTSISNWSQAASIRSSTCSKP